MEKFEKIIILNNEIEAKLLEEILKDQNIPYLIRSYQDSVYDGLWQMQKGWGHLEAPLNYKDKIKTIYREISK